MFGPHELGINNCRAPGISEKHGERIIEMGITVLRDSEFFGEKYALLNVSIGRVQRQLVVRL